MLSHSSSTILAFATKGSNTNEEARLRALLSRLPVEFVPFDKSKKRSSGLALLKTLWRRRPRMVVMEGTGVAGGVPILIARLLLDIRFIVSSGDAVAPFVGAIHPVLKPVFALYERMLCRLCCGFIGWTPYLAGRAMTLGARRAITAAGWGEPADSNHRAEARAALRSRLGIDDETVVFGLLGSLVWNERLGYCYGAELVRAALQLTPSSRVAIVIVGGGSGLDRLRDMAGDRLGKDIFLLGEVPGSQVMDHMAAFDVASLPQSVDGVGSFRYTTKVSEYLAAGLPVVTGRIPMAYDLDEGWLWRLAGPTPWHLEYIQQLSRLMARANRDEIAQKQHAIPRYLPEFDRERQISRVTEFIGDIVGISADAAQEEDAPALDPVSASL
jgi:glycosyltransferase involved in cell wall biosynthesis